MASRRSIVDPDGNFEKFLLSGSGDGAPPAADLLSSPDKTTASSVGGLKPVILPPTLRPQHVYAPMPALGALSLGLKGKKKKGEDEDTDFSKLMNGATAILKLGLSPKFINYHFSVLHHIYT